MTGRRIDPVDTIWLNMDRPNNLMVIDALILFDGRADWDRVLAVLRGRLVDTFPPFRQRAVPPRTPLTLPRWRDDPDFAVERHVHRARLDAPGDDAALRRYIEARMSRPLDRARPLWEVHFIDGHRDGSVMFWRLHHAIADGIALARLLLSLTDGESGPEAGALISADRGVAGRALDVAGALVRRVGTAGAAIPGVAGELSRGGGPRLLGDAAVQAGRTVAIADKLLLGHNPPNPLDGEPGTGKLAVWSRPFPLDDIRGAARLADATVNDVLTSAVAGALASYAADHGAPAEDLTTMVPVNVRPLDRPLDPRLGNRFALVFAKLPVSVPEPVQRLAETKRRMDVIKHSVEAGLTYSLIRFIGRTSPILEQALVDFFAAKAIGVTTNVIGPRSPRYLGGCRIAGILAWVPSSGRQTLGICVVSYDNTVRVGFKADAGAVEDPERLVEAFERQIASLVRIAAARDPAYSKREGSPAPRRRISGSGPDRSTTVLGSVPQEPASTTASS